MNPIMKSHLRLRIQLLALLGGLLLAMFGPPRLLMAEMDNAERQGPWMSLGDDANKVCIVIPLEMNFNPNRKTFVITHGMGGTRYGDRFHLLASAIATKYPEVNVLLIDWTEHSMQTTSLFGMPSPWKVARHIEPTAIYVARHLRKLGLDPNQITFIGESFGNCINAKISELLGSGCRIMAFNPPNAAGGYPLPNLSSCSSKSWSFHTDSAFDTQNSMADVRFFLEPAEGASDLALHTSGITWLNRQIREHNHGWLSMDWDIEATKTEPFDAIATMSGSVAYASSVAAGRGVVDTRFSSDQITSLTALK